MDVEMTNLVSTLCLTQCDALPFPPLSKILDVKVSKVGYNSVRDCLRKQSGFKIDLSCHVA